MAQKAANAPGVTRKINQQSIDQFNSKRFGAQWLFELLNIYVFSKYFKDLYKD